MSAPGLLTVGIPTYNRADSVVRRVYELLEFREEFGIRILVIDNASDDDTVDRLSAEFKDDEVVVLRNDRNLGFAGNLLRLIEVADTDYLTLVSDEDRVDPAGLAALISVLRERRPRLVSPRAQVGDDDCYRGRRRTGPIEPEDFESASFYVSGLTFAVDDTKLDAQTIAEIIPSNAAATFYPQVLLAALAVINGETLFLDALVSRQAEQRPTHISTDGRGAYWFVPSRWAQFEGFEDFFQSAEERYPEGAVTIDRMRTKIRAGVLEVLEGGAVAQFPALAEHLRPSRRKALLGRLITLIGRG